MSGVKIVSLDASGQRELDGVHVDRHVSPRARDRTAARDHGGPPAPRRPARRAPPHRHPRDAAPGARGRPQRQPVRAGARHDAAARSAPTGSLRSSRSTSTRSTRSSTSGARRSTAASAKAGSASRARRSSRSPRRVARASTATRRRTKLAANSATATALPCALLRTDRGPHDQGRGGRDRPGGPGNSRPQPAGHVERAHLRRDAEADRVGADDPRRRARRIDLAVDQRSARGRVAPAARTNRSGRGRRALRRDATTTGSSWCRRDGEAPDLAAVPRPSSPTARRSTCRSRAAIRSTTPHGRERLGITEQVSQFTTNYMPGQARVTNIHRAADIMNNTVVEPGHVFSLNDTVGAANRGTGLRQGTRVLRRVHRGLRRRRQPDRDDHLQRRVLGRVRDRLPPAAHDLLQPLPARSRSDGELPGARPQVAEQLEARRARARPRTPSSSITISLYGDREGRSVKEESTNCSTTSSTRRCVDIIKTDTVHDAVVPCPPKDPKVDPTNECAHLKPERGVRSRTGPHRIRRHVLPGSSTSPATRRSVNGTRGTTT